MLKKRILIALGTRPELIKLYPIIKELGKSKSFYIKICYTGQHKELVKMSSHILNFKPNFSLNVMKKNQNSIDVVENIFKKIKKILKKYNFQSIIVQGDTTTAMAVALAGFYLKKKIYHVEAGLRTHDINDPFPEEGNRKIISQISSIHFAPTNLSRKNLITEGTKNKIYVTGNTVIDTLIEISKKYNIKKNEDKIILCTIHRNENINKNIKIILASLLKIAKDNPDWKIIWPYHLNPIIKKKLKKFVNKRENLLIINSLDYLSFLKFFFKCSLVISDSGGLQEEAAYLGKYVFIMRRKTERPEIIINNLGEILNVNKELIVNKINIFLRKKKWKKIKPSNCFGNGNSAKKIVSILEKIK
jgi:UDP-N-acetylglucosamine 2-epimerase (non-hydrolysing)